MVRFDPTLIEAHGVERQLNWELWFAKIESAPFTEDIADSHGLGLRSSEVRCRIRIVTKRGRMLGNGFKTDLSPELSESKSTNSTLFNRRGLGPIPCSVPRRPEWTQKSLHRRMVK
jgi:hypothetical protein